MAIWGAKIYQNDVSDDVRAQYKDKLHRGMTGPEITQMLIEDFKDDIADDDEAPLFWFALADTQWNVGRLEEFVKEKALFHIQNERNRERWKSGHPKLYKERQKVWLELEAKLNSEQPEEKPYKQYKLYKCEWQVGDLYAYQLTSEQAKEKGLFGRYVLIYKIDESTWHPGHIIPMVRFKLTENDVLPTSEEEINQLQYLKIFTVNYNPIPETTEIPKDLLDRINRTRAQYRELYGDENGYLHYYRTKLVTTSKRCIPKNLIYMGNYPNLIAPKELTVPQHKHFRGDIIIDSTYWKKFEDFIIREYCIHHS